MCVLKRQNTPWISFFEGTRKVEVGESHLHPSPSIICLIHQHLSVQPNKFTPIIGRDPRMPGEISLGAKNSSSKTSDTFSLVRRCHRCAVFYYVTCFDRTNFAGVNLRKLRMRMRTDEDG